MPPRPTEFLAIIPARGGSKGVPRKNVRLLAGKPLIQWTIEAALAARHITRTVVTTDDTEIAAVATGCGAQVVNRPSELAQDTSPTEPALLHVLDTLAAADGFVPDAVVLLQCTSPLRDASIIDAACELWLGTGCDAVLSVAPLQHWVFRGTIGDGQHYLPEYDYANRPRSQDVVPKFSENGALYVTRTSLLRSVGNRLGGDVRALVMDPLHSVDIDREEDFLVTERLMQALASME